MFDYDHDCYLLAFIWVFIVCLYWTLRMNKWIVRTKLSLLLNLDMCATPIVWIKRIVILLTSTVLLRTWSKVRYTLTEEVNDLVKVSILLSVNGLVPSDRWTARRLTFGSRRLINCDLTYRVNVDCLAPFMYSGGMSYFTFGSCWYG